MSEVKRYKMHVRKGDEVVIIAGKDKGKRGKILQVLPKEGRVIVEGVNMIKRHTRPTQANPQGGIVEREAPLHSSNVMPYDAKAGQGVRVRKQVLNDGKKVRVSQKTGEVFDK